MKKSVTNLSPNLLADQINTLSLQCFDSIAWVLTKEGNPAYKKPVKSLWIIAHKMQIESGSSSCTQQEMVTHYFKISPSQTSHQ